MPQQIPLAGTSLRPQFGSQLYFLSHSFNIPNVLGVMTPVGLSLKMLRSQIQFYRCSRDFRYVPCLSSKFIDDLCVRIYMSLCTAIRHPLRLCGHCGSGERRTTGKVRYKQSYEEPPQRARGGTRRRRTAEGYGEYCRLHCVWQN